MKRLVLLVVSLAMGVVLFGCSGAVPGSPAPSPRVRSVAVASLALELDPKAEALLPAPDGGLLQDAADALLQISEAQLARNWQVVPALTYSASEGYRLLALEPSAVLLRPQAGDAELGVFADSDAALRKARITPRLAMDLCAVTGADAVLVIHSGWSVKSDTGGPAARPHSSNTVSLWDRSGNQIFVRRVDKTGEQKVGGVASRGSLDAHQVVGDYLRSYSQALELILK